jgi:hypothetical protein
MTLYATESRGAVVLRMYFPVGSWCHFNFNEWALHRPRKHCDSYWKLERKDVLIRCSCIANPKCLKELCMSQKSHPSIWNHPLLMEVPKAPSILTEKSRFLWKNRIFPGNSSERNSWTHSGMGLGEPGVWETHLDVFEQVICTFRVSIFLTCEMRCLGQNLHQL